MTTSNTRIAFPTERHFVIHNEGEEVVVDKDSKFAVTDGFGSLLVFIAVGVVLVVEVGSACTAAVIAAAAKGC